MNILTKAPPAFALPAALRSRGFALRPETDSDVPFLQDLYASTRTDLAAANWPVDLKRQFLLGQFVAQRTHYRAHYPAAAYDIIEYRGESVGRLYLEERPSRLHVLDIILVPAWRGRGIGSEILRAIVGTAAPLRKGVGIFVEKFNPALALYRRLGFVAIADTGVYLEMEWLPDRAGDQANVAQ